MTNIQQTDQDIIQKQSLKLNKQKLRSLKARTKKPPVRSNSYILGDISGSMSGRKLNALKDAYKAVWRPGVNGIVFSDDVFLIEESDIDQLDTQGGTGMGQALLAAWQESAAHIILITDGNPTDMRKERILDLARQHDDVPIDCIGISDGRFGDYDPYFLQQLSDITHGKYNNCNEPLELTRLVEQLLIDAPKARLKGGDNQGGGVIEL